MIPSAPSNIISNPSCCWNRLCYITFCSRKHCDQKSILKAFRKFNTQISKTSICYIAFDRSCPNSVPQVKNNLYWWLSICARGSRDCWLWQKELDAGTTWSAEFQIVLSIFGRKKCARVWTTFDLNVFCFAARSVIVRTFWDWCAICCPKTDEPCWLGVSFI